MPKSAGRDIALPTTPPRSAQPPNLLLKSLHWLT
jgi:hypothetical protein